MKNKPLTKYKKRKIIDCFSLELTATQTADFLKINRNTINRYFMLTRKSIADYQKKTNPVFDGEVELDESYFGGRHKGNIGRSVKSKIPVFGILKRNGIVYTQIVPDVSARTLKTIVKQKVREGSTIFSDSWRSYDGLILYGYEHFRINHHLTFVDNTKNHINGIESFWSYAKMKLTKFYGIKPKYFYLYLKEQEFRFNNRDKNLSNLIWNIFTKFCKYEGIC
jgi:transposase-like protein